MNIKTRVIQSVLDFYFKTPPVPLNSVNEFTFLVAVVLSAQTTDGIVNQVTKELFRIASTPQQMSSLPIAEVQQLIQSVGLANSKAKYLVGLSEKIVNSFGGRVPSTFTELESLPGVGHKTASVIMSQVFGVPSIAVDTHVHRLALRWGLTKEQKSPDKVQSDLCKLFPQDSWNKLHLQMIYFGREYCTAKNHSNHECPICSWINKPASSIDDSIVLCKETLSQFVSKPRSKGIVFYSDRLSELNSDTFLGQCINIKSTSSAIASSPESTSKVSEFTQSMTNLMNGYKVDSTPSYKSPVRCDASHNAAVIGEVYTEQIDFDTYQYNESKVIEPGSLEKVSEVNVKTRKRNNILTTSTEKKKRHL